MEPLNNLQVLAVLLGPEFKENPDEIDLDFIYSFSCKGFPSEVKVTQKVIKLLIKVYVVMNVKSS